MNHGKNQSPHTQGSDKRQIKSYHHQSRGKKRYKINVQQNSGVKKPDKNHEYVNAEINKETSNTSKGGKNSISKVEGSSRPKNQIAFPKENTDKRKCSKQATSGPRNHPAGVSSKTESTDTISKKSSIEASSGPRNHPAGASSKTENTDTSSKKPRNHPSGAIPKENIPKRKRRRQATNRSGKQFDKELDDLDYVTSSYAKDPELDEYFKAIESDEEEDTETPGSDKRQNERSDFQFWTSSLISNNVVLRDTVNRHLPEIKSLKKGKEEPVSKKAMASQMIGNVGRLMGEARRLLDEGDLTTARQKVNEAIIMALDAEDQRLLLGDPSNAHAADFAEWFGTCAVILNKLGDFWTATRCFYTATVFDVNWTEQQHVSVSQTLWDNIFLGNPPSLQPERILDILKEMEILAQLAERRHFWSVCLCITVDIGRREQSLMMLSSLLQFRYASETRPLARARRLARCSLKMGHHKAVQTTCMNILAKLTEYNDREAFEIWAVSLFIQKKYDIALGKARNALQYAETPEDRERLNKLLAEIQSKVPDIESNHEIDPDWLPASVPRPGTLKKAASTSNLTAGKTQKSKTRHRRPKARDRSQPESNSPSPAESVNSSRAPSPSPSLPSGRFSNSTTTLYDRKKQALQKGSLDMPGKTDSVPLNNVAQKLQNELQRRRQKGRCSRGSSESSTGFNVADLPGFINGIPNVSDSDDTDSEPSMNATDTPTTHVEQDIETEEEETSFYEQTCHRYADLRWRDFDTQEDISDEKLMTYGIELNMSYLHPFREKQSEHKPYYSEFLSEEKLREKLLQRPEIYKRCIIHIDGSHISNCYPVDSKENGQVIEISGRLKAGQTYNEDEVVVELLDKPHENKDRRYGKVLGVLRRQRYKDVKHPVFICTLDDMESYLVRPLCKTVPKISILNKKVFQKFKKFKRYKVEVYTYDHLSQTLSEDPVIQSVNPGDRDTYVFLVAVINWSLRKIYPTGAVIRMLKCGDTIQRGLTILNLQHKVPALYSKETYESVEGLMHRYNGSQCYDGHQERQDLCHLNTFTIDPPGSQDLDDALSVETIDGGYRVGVHIADVSAFVRKDDPVDLEARNRAVTYYPTIRRPRNMLPEPLSSSLCSLLPNQQKRAISIFFLLDNEGRPMQMEGNNYEIVRSVIKSRNQLTYREVQDVINGSTDHHHPQKEDIIRLFKLAKKIRWRRLGNAMFALDVENDEDLSEDCLTETLEAHYLVEEFMIMANHKVASILTKRFPGCTPIRSQPPPSKESMEEFLKKDSGYLNILVRLQGKTICDGIHPDMEESRGDKSQKCIMVSKALWELFRTEPEKAVHCLKMDDLYPIQRIIYQHWINIQERAEYQCHDASTTSSAKHMRHFSLNMYPYTHFTSPIRRYNDLVIHRLLVALLTRSPSPYDRPEVEQICVHVNAAMKRAKAYQRGCRSLQQAIELGKTPQTIQCFVDEPTERGVSLCAPELKYVDRRQRQLPFNQVDMSRKPELIEDTTTNYDKVKGVWRKRIYNTSGVSSGLPSKGHQQTLDPNPGVVFVPLHSWARMLLCAVEGRKSDLVSSMKNAKVHQSEHGLTDVSTESLKPTEIQPNTVFSLTFSHGQTLKCQMSSVPQKGLLTPQIVLYNMTDNVKLCLLHMDDPVLHLARYIVNPTSSQYKDAKSYVNTWLPIMLMEAAVGAIRNEENCIINNVPIRFDTKYEGKFVLRLAYCEIRNIDFSGIDDEGDTKSDPKAYDWLCLKFVSPTEKQVDYRREHLPKPKPVWVAHAEITSVKKKVDKETPEDSKITVTFRLHERSPELPLEARPKDSRFSVEVLCKTEVDRRTESFIKRLEKEDSSSIALKIGLNNANIPSLDSDHAHIADIIEKDLYIEYPDSVPLPRNNPKQQEAINKALKNRFSLIQGPPGTGKSYTGIKLMCLFDKINYIIHKEGGKKHQVLFCGPSNKSVDLVARWMLTKLGEKTPKFLRVYGRSIEAIEFPIPGRTFLSRRSTHNQQADDQLQTVSLHHLIRKKGEKYAEEITSMDRMFAANNYAPDPDNVKKYVHLIREASIDMIRKYDVILCTTAVGSNPKVLEATSVFQVIVDEAGMCPEPQCLVPMLATKAEQIVLIGDHKQLRPIVMCKEAAELGLDKSLFERYADNKKIPFTMLQWQYRMNPKICQFPSENFYEGKLVTKSGFWAKDCIKIWPTKRDLRGVVEEYPHVLIHVEGEEKVLTVSTEEGHEHSRSNQQEIDLVVKVYKYLIEVHGLDGSQINVMSQYNAQVSQIKDRLGKENFQNYHVNTVVSCQGGEWDYVIFSTVRSLPGYKIEENPTLGWCQQNLGFITDNNQINVALTRARKGLIIIGNKNLLTCDEVWKKLISHYELYGCIKSPEEFPPKKKSRLEIMEERMQRNVQRFGDTIYQRGYATSYDGPIDSNTSIDSNSWQQPRGRGGRKQPPRH